MTAFTQGRGATRSAPTHDTAMRFAKHVGSYTGDPGIPKSEVATLRPDPDSLTSELMPNSFQDLALRMEILNNRFLTHLARMFGLPLEGGCGNEPAPQADMNSAYRNIDRELQRYEGLLTHLE